jgi:tRNA threonylcarbamoyl adenosine modification protein (Sua5/YciO/YrdC/YwlC family)
MTQRFALHRVDPQRRLLRQAAKILHAGGLVAVPTDACFALVCHLADKEAAQRLRAIRGIDDKHLLTLLCRDLSEISTYALVDNRQYRFIRALVPGPYTFVLPATRVVPKRLAHPSRKTVGLRVPGFPIISGLLEELGEPLLASTLTLPGAGQPMTDPDEIARVLAKRIDLLLEAGIEGATPTTIIDLTGPEPLIQRIGAGPVERIATM